MSTMKPSELLELRELQLSDRELENHLILVIGYTL